MASKEDLYIILEVGRKASVNDIKRAFRKLARRYHPDINPGDHLAEARFKRITEAYEILSDPSKRQFYDANGFYTDGVLDPGAASWGFSFQGFDFTHSKASEFDEIFGQFFANRILRRQPERGQDLEHQVSLSFNESIRGLCTALTVFRKRSCDSCGGTGRASGSRETTCGMCGGSGKSTRMKGHLQFAVTCADCGGTGRAFTVCNDCAGEGRVPAAETLEVTIPPGVSTGSRIRLVGKGDAGRYGGPGGDLYIVAKTEPHPFFNRVGDNIHCVVSITMTEAALGAKIEVPTIDGQALVRIPPGSQSGQKFRLRNKGMPSLLDPDVRGDQYVEIKVVVPRIGDERSKEILRELARLNPGDPRADLWKP